MVFHVRLIAPLKQRIKHIQNYYKLDGTKAKTLVATADEGYKRYVRQNFDSSINDPLVVMAPLDPEMAAWLHLELRKYGVELFLSNPVAFQVRNLTGAWRTWSTATAASG